MTNRALKAALLLLAGCGLMHGPVSAKTVRTDDWVRGFAAAPMYLPRSNEQTIDNQTIRIPVRLTVAGSQIVVRLSHEHGRSSATISAASVTIHDGAATRILPLHFSGDDAATIAPGAVVVSDPVAVTVKANEVIDISLYVAQPTLLSTIHRDPSNAALISTPGNFTQVTAMPTAGTTIMRPFVSAVDVLPDKPIKTIVTFGDSISDWDCPYTNDPCQWEGELAQRLAKASKIYAISNAAISANRILADSFVTSPTWQSVSAEARFERDALSVPNVSAIIFMEGVNDITMSGPNADPSRDSPVVSADAIIAGIKHLIARAHARGIRIYGAEIMPFGGVSVGSADKEAVRIGVNTWIRTSGAFDAVINFQGAVADPTDPTRLLKSFDNGDHLHPNVAGQKAMGDAIDLNLFP